MTAVRLIFISIVSIFLLSACGGDSGNASFEDPNLEACVNEAVSNSGVTDAQELTELSCWNSEINSIKGLEKLTNLSSLNLGYNNLTNISTLAELTNLSSLDLSNNKLTDISALAELVNLEYLYFR